ncbi:sensor histidine kinase [Marinobacterium sediminicola]|uniref:histidine kinase n=1 Tax=Marinobacterium sediminicola TaxID=518898 RepID=A0ABY1S3H2_9GAMM|nr:HAMP domain-containing sensor histidine kinase [Marinobacterium sediminicola]ULG68186.1 HAMP domain-containing histidine kinase [Marinobacterium sediminicola]SMR77713.1 Signal transduction histidine kinase [Marinobacterium sediminicola]
MTFSSRIILTVDFSTLVLTSLYWLVGWHYVEQIEDQQSEALQGFIGQRADLVVSGQLDAEVLQLIPGVELYRGNVLPVEGWQIPDAPGAYRVGQGGTVLVRVQPETGERYALYLPVLERLVAPEESEAVEALVVVGGVLLFTFGAMGLTLWLIWKQTVPVRQLMQAVVGVSPESPQLEPLERSDELGELSRQFAALLQRTQNFIQREQSFTRFASHELRTPLMTLRSSLGLLQEMGASDAEPMQQRALDRMAYALERMEKLTDSFLWLSREQKAEHGGVNRAELERLLQQQKILTPALGDQLVLSMEGDWFWPIHPFVLSVVLDNLVRNAQDHGQGAIEVRASGKGLSVRNQLPEKEGADDFDTDHFGYGLSIVEHLCTKAGARFQSETANGHFLAEIRF